MNGINRRSQKVVCVQEVEFVSITGRTIPVSPTPVLGEVYTVDGFLNNGEITADPELAPAITLLEVKTPTAKMRDGQYVPVGWPITCFRPLVDSPSAEVAALLEIITKAPSLTPVGSHQ